jgi:hypothetical protein
MTFSANKTAGLIYLASAFAVFGIWCVLLFVDTPPSDATLDTVSYFLSDKTENPLWFRWTLVGFPLLCMALSIAYFLCSSQARVGPLILFCSGLLLAMAAWGTIDFGIAGLVSTPLVITFKDVWRHLTSHSTDTPHGDR